MATNLPIRIGGVPEHFNMPWHWALGIGLFKKEGIDLFWTDYPSGTGAMNKSLRDNELDIAIVLTEGSIADIINGNPSRVVSWYVKSPLVWGIHTSSGTWIDISQISGKKYAISRIGSGSHLMAHVDADQRGLKLSDNQFVIVNNLDGAIKSLSSGESDLFLWERFTTKPLVDKGVFKRIDECPTPWPCFAIVVRDEFLKKYPDKVKVFLSIIQNEASKFKALPSAISLISERYGLKPEDVNDWMKTVEWADPDNASVEREAIQLVIHQLYSLGLIKTNTFPLDQIIQTVN
jgi:sulfonate transport system substrate-binding protein